jgi:Undecaprenyl-phosphate glucose phosphotransferase
MNKFDSSSRFTQEAVRRLGDGEAAGTRRTALRPMAEQVARQYRRDTMSPTMVSGIMRITDFLLLALCGMLLYAFYVGLSTRLQWHYPIVILGASALAVMLLQLCDCYQLPTLRAPLQSAGRIVLVWAGTTAVLALAGFFLKISGQFSRFWLGGWLVWGACTLIAERAVVASQIRRWTRDGRIELRALFVVGGQNAESLILSNERQPFNDIRICGIFDDRDDRRSPPLVAGYPKLGNIAELIEFARIARIDMLIVSLPITAEKRVLSMLKKLWVLPVDIRRSAHTTQLRFRPRAYSYIGALPMLDIFDRPIHDWDSVAKRVFDIIFSLVGIALFSPVMLATAIAIKLDSRGPVLFKQKRHGFNNEEIEVFKFRSMYVEQCDPTARHSVTKDDPRVTRVGRFIRKTSIDELPQFFNALFGSLSLVGPRPHAVAAQSHNRLYNDVVDGYFARHRVKPGVTGWAQVNGWRGELDTDEKLKMRTEYDLYYIENWSLLFDLRILVTTPASLLKTESAY